MSAEPDNTIRSTEPAGPPLPLHGMEATNIPKQIGKFRIIDLVAPTADRPAGMALVYKAEQDDPRRTVALKIPRGGKLLSVEARKRFLREVGLVARIEHAGIVPVLETGEVDGVPFYTMPFIEGRALDHHVQLAKLDSEKRLELFLRVCGVVQTLHAENLVHRDLKPDNIMVDKHGDIRLLDFGLAKALADTREQMTTDQTLLGTLQFMAPEQTAPGRARPPGAPLEVDNTITPATDVYALGVILYWLLSDAYPYNVEGSQQAALEAIRTIIPEPPSRKSPTLPRRYDDLVLACLRKEPGSRPQTAGNLAEMLRATMENKPVTIPEAAPVGPAGPAGRSGFRHRLLPVLAIAAGVVALTVGLIAAFFPALFGGSRSVVTASSNPSVGATSQSRPADENPPSSFIPPPSSLQVYSPSDIAAAASGHSTLDSRSSSSPIPPELWPLYDKALRSLREDFAHRRDGAVLIKPANTRAAVFLTYQIDGEGTTREQSIEPGGAAVLYLRADAKCTVECLVDGNVIRKVVSAPQGEVAYVELR